MSQSSALSKSKLFHAVLGFIYDNVPVAIHDIIHDTTGYVIVRVYSDQTKKILGYRIAKRKDLIPHE